MKRLSIILAIALHLILVCQCAFGDLVGFSYDDWALYQLDIATMQSTKIGDLDIPRAADLACMTAASASSAYMVGREQDTLYTVSLEDASMIASVSLDRDMLVNGRGLALSPTGVLHGVFAGRELRSIDPITGSTALIMRFDTWSVESLAFSSEGVLYVGQDHGGTGRFSAVDVSTGTQTDFAQTGAIADPDAMAYLDGYLYAADSVGGISADLYRIDAVSGGVVNLGNTGITGLNGMVAIEQITTPLPSAALLAVLGLGVARWRLRRQ